jgi:hypothetical protein
MIYFVHTYESLCLFFDDILVYNKNWNSHLKHNETVLNILQENKFYTNKSKCSFGQKYILFSGHVVSDDGIKVDPKKIATVSERPSPKSITLSRGFLGLTGYYKRLVLNYAQIVAPLTKLLKKDAFKWNDEDESCFRRLKLLMSSTLVLSAPYFSKSFFLECDALGARLSAIIMQDNHPIAFESRKFKPREQTKSTHDK